MQAPPPTPDSDFPSLNGTPREREECLPTSLPSLARILNEQVAAMDYVNNALMEHLDRNLIIERIDSLNIPDLGEVSDKLGDNSNLLNGHNEGPKRPTTSTVKTSCDEIPHPTGRQIDRAINPRPRRSYSMSDVDHIIARSSPPPAMALEVVRALQLSDAEIRRSDACFNH